MRPHRGDQNPVRLSTTCPRTAAAPLPVNATWWLIAVGLGLNLWILAIWGTSALFKGLPASWQL
jgi:hypothetical protein